MEKGKIKNFFPGGNTSQGFYSFYDYLPYKTERAFIIKGGPGTGKSTFMKKIGYEMTEHGYNIEFHWCSSDNNSLDGVVIPALKLAILDGTAPHMIDPENPGAVEEIVNLGEYWNSSYLRKHRQEIIKLNKLIKKRFKQVYHYLKIAKLVHDEWESYYIEGLNLNKANQKIAEIIDLILTEKSPSTPGPGRHLFASAITPGGVINYFDNLTEEIGRRFIVKGEPGTGKSTLIKKVADVIAKYGYEILYLHCGFVPESLDAIIIPGLDTAIINGTPPHTLEAKRDGDQIIDMMACVNLTVLKQYADEIAEVKSLFDGIMKRVFNHLKQAKETHDEIEEFYITAMDFKQVENKRKEILREIFEL
ncbi:MAG: hypothetical protein PWR10_2325 [Halanaerobiales bacterium]|nr:hypothetical protein [Halanaerobiales bacterium]